MQTRKTSNPLEVIDRVTAQDADTLKTFKEKINRRQVTQTDAYIALDAAQRTIRRLRGALIAQQFDPRADKYPGITSFYQFLGMDPAATGNHTNRAHPPIQIKRAESYRRVRPLNDSYVQIQLSRTEPPYGLCLDEAEKLAQELRVAISEARGGSRTQLRVEDRKPIREAFARGYRLALQRVGQKLIAISSHATAANQLNELE